MNRRKGIILAGGLGTRLYPLTRSISKQLLPIYDKPMIYYPLNLLMQADVKEIAIITKPEDKNQFKRLLGNGNEWGCQFSYIEQLKPEGLAQAYVLAENFLQNSNSILILGDNIFYGEGLMTFLQSSNKIKKGSTIFGYQVNDPTNYGNIQFNKEKKIIDVLEKPIKSKSKYAITGLYFFDNTASRRAKKIKPSKRGELEIISLIKSYLDDNLLNYKLMGRGFAWLDTGTLENLSDASNFVKSIQQRQGVKIGCPEETAYQNGWINNKQLKKIVTKNIGNQYSDYLKSIVQKNS